ncbi:class I SAM-dependent rRNA methyltransferase [Treponema rectale]|uniref:23S rRNA (Cytosine1962-C5)-methyltransferase n=1 Tax=Treponema rectale TaxID=744512 RepID=A0A840SBC7_9SPIR|nr:class I SAM-dependent rRNA methyltransferase [Treponema rectale]MBB5218095.1 23S rRNA (cytosine1962-C5)-methyltransferase [Treponema rectale]QOS40193.1 class I SAM-dependent rRNA methyltransferase [Treponema rectale]
MNDVTRVFLNPKEDLEISQGFPWVYDNEINSVKFYDKNSKSVKTSSLKDCLVKDGDVVEVYAAAGGFLGTGVINRTSKITVRMIGSEHADRILENPAAYWKNVVLNALNIRRVNFSETDSYRLIFGEADFIPGFIVERFYSDGKVYLVVQFLALACEVFRKELLDALEETVKPYAVYERSDASIREKEGLEERAGWIGRTGSEVIKIEENGIFLEVDIARGQKTGYFLDQKFNRREAARYCKGKKVLDTFTHTGAFGLNAYKAGAREVISVDISQEAVDMVNRNITINGAQEKMKAVCADVFDLLKKYEADGEKFDVIILDPPAFTKSAKLIQKAYGGYKEINLRAMRLLNEGGILITCSCSHYFDENNFYSMVMHAAKDSHKKVQILQKRGAAPDHPVLSGYPKSEYLKCAICRVL